jgi:DNA-directed RNA polymerase specialized sigma24 family protein
VSEAPRGVTRLLLEWRNGDAGALDERKARVVELRCFVGLSVREAAEVLQVSEETVFRDWRMAKLWLGRELSSAAR